MGKLVRNPAYNDRKVSLNNWCYVRELSRAKKPKFHAALVESIRAEGVRNPIILYALPDGWFLGFGGSRVKAAIEAGEELIPAIINDYNDEFKTAPTVEQHNWHKFFADPPQTVEFTEHGFDYHYHMERNRRNAADPAAVRWIKGNPSWLREEFPWLTSYTQK